MMIAVYVGVALLGVLALLAAYAKVTRPDIFRVSRSIVIAAPPADIFARIENLREMARWNPYSLREPSATTSYSGPAAGVGATHEFDGKKSGSGSIAITSVDRDRRVDLRLLMTRPFKCDNAVQFLIEADGAASRVTWAMEGPSPLLAKMMQTVMDADKMVGRDFEEGLANLKRLVETRA